MITTTLNQRGMTRRFEPGEIEVLLGSDFAEQPDWFDTALQLNARKTEARDEKRSTQTKDGSEGHCSLVA